MWAAREARSNHCLSTGKLPELISAPICLSSLLRGEVEGHIPSSVSVGTHASCPPTLAHVKLFCS